MKIRNIIFAVCFFTLLSGCTKLDETESGINVPEYRTITMDDLKTINGDNLEIEYNGNRIAGIDGEFAYFPVTDRYKAYEAFMGVTELLGIENTEDFVYDENASHETPGGLNTYLFSQYHNEIKVLGANVRIIVNPEHTERVSIYSTYEPNLDIITEPKISKKEAIKRAESEYNAEVYGKPELVIYNRELAWDIDLSTSEICNVIMNAHDGKILCTETEIID